MTLDRDEEDREWDAFLASSPHGYHEQTSLYAILRREYGFHSARAVVRDATNEIVGGVQVLYKKTPIGRLGLVYRGPIARDDDPETLKRVVSAMTKLASRERLSSIRVETFPTQEQTRQVLSSAGYYSSTAWTDEHVSAFIDLQMTNDAMLAKMKRPARNQIRGAMRKGVTITVADPNDMRDFFELHQKTSGHQEFHEFPERYFSYLRELFGADRVPVFIAKYEGKPISTLMCFVMENHLYACWFGMDRDPILKKLNSNRLLYFEAMKWGSSQGIEGFDLTGTGYFRRHLAHHMKKWPSIQRRHFGPTKSVHRFIVERCGRIDPVRLYTSKAARRLGYIRQMPH